MNHFVEEYVPVNGIEHYLLHYPKEPGTPVLLYLHGGPGNFDSLFAYTLERPWGDMFTHVHWDQRGAGRTLRRNKKAGLPKSVDQMLDDLHGVVEHLQQKYQVEKVVLLGHSWGTLLGSLYVLRHPENVLAYIGVGQVISMMENERTAYREVMEMAKKAGNLKHIRAMEQLGEYPPRDPELLLKKLPKLRKIQEAYDSSQASGFSLGVMIKIMRRSPSFQWGALVSFMRAMQANRLILPQILSFNLGDLPPKYQVPVHYILGELDTVTPTSLSKAYYETIDAPYKTFTTLPGAGHIPVYERLDEFAAALRSVRKTLR